MSQRRDKEQITRSPRQPPVSGPADVVVPTLARDGKRSLRWGWAVGLGLVVMALAVAAGIAVLPENYRSHLWQGGRAVPPEEEGIDRLWKGGRAVTEEEQLIDRFVRSRNDGDARALELLGPEAIFDDNPVSEDEAEARCADYYLRSDVQIIDIRRGQPDRSGRVKPAPGRYTLSTRCQGSTPPLRVRDDRGAVGHPSRLFMINPNLVVEVRDGRIHPVRTELSAN